MRKLSAKSKSALSNVFYPLLSLALILGVWAIAAAIKDNALLLPMPDKVFSRFFGLFAESGFWLSVGWTVLRVLECFALSFVLALGTAMAGAVWKPFHRVLSPIITVLRAAPTMAMILLAMIWLDYGRAPVLIGFLVAYPVLYSAFYAALSGVPDELIQMTRVYKVGAADRIRYLYIPQTLPAVFESSRSTISLTAKVVIAAEVLSHTRNSIGLEMQRANLSFEIGELMAWTVLAILLSFVLEWAVQGLRKLWEVRR